MDQIEIREGARRQHRCLTMFCALYCWNQDKTICYVGKDQFLLFLGLERLKEIRFKWFVEDGKAYFPHIFQTKNSKGKELIVLSRVDEKELVTNKPKYKDKSILLKPSIFSLENYKLSFLEQNGEQLKKIFEEAFPFIKSVNNYYEFSILNVLSLLANGAISPELALSNA